MNANSVSMGTEHATPKPTMLTMLFLWESAPSRGDQIDAHQSLDIDNSMDTSMKYLGSERGPPGHPMVSVGGGLMRRIRDHTNPC